MICTSVVRDAMPLSNMADKENTNMEVEENKNKPSDNSVNSLFKTVTAGAKNENNLGPNTNDRRGLTTTEYCEELHAWMWQYYTGYVNWQSWLTAAAALPCPFVLPSASGATLPLDVNLQNWHNGPYGLVLSSHPAGATSQSSRAGGASGGAAVTAQPQQLGPENGNALRPGKLCCFRTSGRLFCTLNLSEFFPSPSIIQTSLNDLSKLILRRWSYCG